MPESESYSNPIAPSHDHYIDEDDDERSAARLTNDDFRKLLMTPRAPPAGSSSQSTPATFAKPRPVENKDGNNPASLRKKKKSYYAQLKKEENEKEKELAEKYRDRAKERREGANTADNNQPQMAEISTTANYRAVAPDINAGENLAKHREQLIKESKFLGGDMEHTHLVKGLDYALLEKVKAEIMTKEQEEEMAMLENAVKNLEKDSEDSEDQITFRTKLARNIFRALPRNPNRPIERNDLFIPGRMCYVVELEESEENNSDIPTTLIRSKADCVNLGTMTTLSNNDIVINKLTQILTYLRQSRARDKKKRKEKGKLKFDDKTLPVVHDENIFELDSKHKHHHGSHKSGDKFKSQEGHRRRDDDRGREGRRSYFEKPIDEDDDKEKEQLKKLSAKEFVKNVNERFGKSTWGGGGVEGTSADVGADGVKKPSKEEERMKKIRSKMDIDSYAECYPGMMESVDALGDSDDEADYTKMDQGNKKGPVGRWDFETQEEYSKYMSAREAMPKAAFQYGVKMADGRKTRRAGPRDDKKELDREWTKIQNIIAKRKPGDDGPIQMKKGKH